jgi:hypothetical protein
MQITTEQLITLYQRVEQYYIAKFGKTADYISLESDGTFHCYREEYCCGDTDRFDELYISPEVLNDDLDKLVELRKLEEEKRRLAQLEKNRIEKENREFREKEKRKAEYLKLKKEFE